MGVSGSCDSRFASLGDVFASGFDTQAQDPVFGETGAALAIVLDGQVVVDLWGGVASTASNRPWQADTIANVYSASKGVTALAALLLADRGQLDLQAPVTRYWPEFASAERESITVAMLLDHTAGLPAIRDDLPHEALYDWKAMTASLAAEAPWWQPGSRHGYHAFTFGWLVGEVVRRVSGRSLGQYVREEIAGPLEADVHIGLPEAEHARVADLSPLPLGGAEESEAAALVAHFIAEPRSASARAFMNPPDLLSPATVASGRWRTAEIPAANAHATARGLALVYGALVAGSQDRRWLGSEGLHHCIDERVQGLDEVLRMPTRFSLGFMLSQPTARFGTGARTFGHPGAGGSLAFADPDAGLGFGYVPNRLGPNILVDPRAGRLADVAYQCL
jgi:CubicO group peptidase (beta-lactamase class C family)